MKGLSGVEEFGSYELLSPLGEGSLATVFRAIGPNGEPVVLKRLRSDHLSDPKAQQAFHMGLSLGEVAGSVSVIHNGEFEGIPFRVLPWKAGPTLDKFIALFRTGHEPVPLGAALYIAREIAQVLDHLHNQLPAVFHGDLKPSNVVVLPTGQMRLIDMVGQGPFISYGDLRCAAPEVVEKGPVNEQVDIFAVGAILYELLTFEGLHLDRTRPQLIESVRRGPDESRLQLLRKLAIPDDVQSVIRKMVAIEPEARFATAGELTSALKSSYLRHRSHFEIRSFFERACKSLGFTTSDENLDEEDDDPAEFATMMAQSHELPGGDDDDDFEDLATIMAGVSPFADMSTEPLPVARPSGEKPGPKAQPSKGKEPAPHWPGLNDLTMLQTQETSRAAILEAMRTVEVPSSANAEVPETTGDTDPRGLTLDLEPILEAEAREAEEASKYNEALQRQGASEQAPKIAPAQVSPPNKPSPGMVIHNTEASQVKSPEAEPSESKASKSPATPLMLPLNLSVDQSRHQGRGLFYTLIGAVTLLACAMAFSQRQGAESPEDKPVVAECATPEFWSDPKNIGRLWHLELYSGVKLQGTLQGVDGCRLKLLLPNGKAEFIAPEQLASASLGE